MAGDTSNCCRLGAHSVYIIQLCNSLHCHFFRRHICRVRVCLAAICQPGFWARPGSLTYQHTGGTDKEIRVSIESWPRRGKFSRRSYKDSNLRPFDHESGAWLWAILAPMVNCGYGLTYNIETHLATTNCIVNSTHTTIAMLPWLQKYSSLKTGRKTSVWVKAQTLWTWHNHAFCDDDFSELVKHPGDLRKE